MWHNTLSNNLPASNTDPFMPSHLSCQFPRVLHFHSLFFIYLNSFAVFLCFRVKSNSISQAPFPVLASFLSTTLGSKHAKLLASPQKWRALLELCAFVHAVPTARNALKPLFCWLNTICPQRPIAGKAATNFPSLKKCPLWMPGCLCLALPKVLLASIWPLCLLACLHYCCFSPMRKHCHSAWSMVSARLREANQRVLWSLGVITTSWYGRCGQHSTGERTLAQRWEDAVVGSDTLTASLILDQAVFQYLVFLL